MLRTRTFEVRIQAKFDVRVRVGLRTCSNLRGRIQVRHQIFNKPNYTPGNSRYNPVERSMSLLSNWLVGLTLKREYNSNASKPHNLDDALICLYSYWDKRKYDGFQ
ncbi:unnamed protein product [Didymodactylos carnosus]|uniref:Uncharacterized protein n=1 Tax=Didymodactylos carnosus TaxID=1234261 RepID=A0A815JBR5_9BILA|nr:unnamed protein product [Didymodactylos carnosus]CAF4266110.1 unnamed protein product [Didymodactylos carnosus]